ncbi:MAG: hypothetical protein AB1568_16810 [Thermodesulfobacteriota bacterium]
MTVRTDDPMECCRRQAEGFGLQVVVLPGEAGLAAGLLLARPGVSPEAICRNLPAAVAGDTVEEADAKPAGRRRFSEDLQVTVAERQQLFALFNETV